MDPLARFPFYILMSHALYMPFLQLIYACQFLYTP